MKHEGEQVLLRMHLSNFAKWHMGALYEALVARALKEHLAGATVLSGFYGYVDRGRILGDHPNTLRVEQPVVLEFVDQAETLHRFLDAVEPMLEGHSVLVTLERANVLQYRGDPAGPA